MPGNDLTLIIATTAGIIGAVSGLFGSIMSVVTYRKHKQTKSLDLRIELKRTIANVNSDYVKLREKMVEADQSRINLLAARNFLNSSERDNWKSRLEKHQETAGEIKKKIPSENTKYSHLNEKKLEERLIEIHKIKNEIQRLLEKYEESIAYDKAGFKTLNGA